MRKTILTYIFLIFANSLFGQDSKKATYNFNEFNSLVLKGGIKREYAVKQFDSLINTVNHLAFIRSQIDPVIGPNWVFPLQGYNSKAIGGYNGNGYQDKGYHYLDGNKHLAHPAHDIFIRDKNQDCLDDKTNLPVNVLAIENGMVVACTNDWDSKSNLRGGKYIWIYHPSEHFFTYYAHNGTIFVRPYQWVKQGQKIAEVGRTGYNAYKKRSPTHLHFSAFKLVDGLPVPFNPYKQLTKAITQ